MEYRIIKEEVVYQGYLQVLEAVIEHDAFDSKKPLRVTREAAHRSDGCAILLFEKETEKFIFVKQFRYPTAKADQAWMTEIVAGNIEPGDTAKTTIRREVEEEVGYAIRDLESMGSFFVSPGRTTERIFLFFAEVSIHDKVKPGGGLTEEQESIQTLKYSLQEVKEMLRKNHFQDGKTIIALQQYLLYK